jgi:hypothetical protein
MRDFKFFDINKFTNYFILFYINKFQIRKKIYIFLSSKK